MPVDGGSITPSSAHAATAASAAVPPERSTSIAVSAASGCEVATIAFWEWTVDRPARWKFLMPSCSLCLCSLAFFLGRYPAPICRGLLAHSSGPGQWWGGVYLISGSSPPFPSPARLIDHRNAVQSRRLLSIRSTAGLPPVARAVAGDLRRLEAERQCVTGS